MQRDRHRKHVSMCVRAGGRGRERGAEKKGAGEGHRKVNDLIYSSYLGQIKWRIIGLHRQIGLIPEICRSVLERKWRSELDELLTYISKLAQ